MKSASPLNVIWRRVNSNQAEMNVMALPLILPGLLTLLLILCRSQRMCDVTLMMYVSFLLYCSDDLQTKKPKTETGRKKWLLLKTSKLTKR